MQAHPSLHMLIDSHCHVDAATWPDGVDAVLDRAIDAGVGGFVAVGIGGTAAAQEAIALAHRRSDVAATVGVHPHDALGFDEVWPTLEPLLADERVVAVGETGLDYHCALSPRTSQLAAFRRSIQAAKACHKPIVVHTRAAPAETLAVLEEEGARDAGGVIHCFSEDRAFARRVLDLGFDLGFTGIVSFKNAGNVRDVAAWAPLDRVLLETDSPYLAPIPLRGRKCEPGFIVHTARCVAELRGLSVDVLTSNTTENAARRFARWLDARARVAQNQR